MSFRPNTNSVRTQTYTSTKIPQKKTDAPVVPSPASSDNSNLTEPTIENPFVKKKTPVLPHKPAPKDESIKAQVENFHSGFFVAPPTTQMLTERIEKGDLEIGDLPFVYKMGMYISRVIGVNGPSTGHIEIAAVLKNMENFEAVAEGKMKMPELSTEYRLPEPEVIRNGKFQYLLKATLDLYKGSE